MHQRKKSDWGLIEGKFINTSESASRSVLGLFMQLCKSTLTVSLHPPSCVTEEKHLQTVEGTYLTTINSYADDFA